VTDKTEKPKRMKQNRLPDFDGPGATEIREAAERYVESRDERMELTKDEVKHHDILLGIMKRHKQKALVVDGLAIEIVFEKEKVKVKRLGGNGKED
jgi:hypothetical protein